jgi:hypothetical protein
VSPTTSGCEAFSIRWKCSSRCKRPAWRRLSTRRSGSSFSS